MCDVPCSTLDVKEPSNVILNRNLDCVEILYS